MKYSRMWIREEDGSGHPNYDTQIYVDNPSIIPRHGEFIDGPVYGWVDHIQYSYTNKFPESGKGEMNQVIVNVYLTNERP